MKSNSHELHFIGVAARAIASMLLIVGAALPIVAQAQQYTTSVQGVTSAPTNWPTAGVTVGAPLKVVGGGARTNSTGSGNLLTQTSPGAPGQNAWIGSAKDHLFADPTTLGAYGIGLADPNDDWDVGIFAQTSGVAAHPVASAALPAGYALTGGGCFVNWRASPPAAGNLLTASFPSSLTTWECRSKDHAQSSPAAITAYVIGIRPKKAGMVLPTVKITTAVSAVTNHPEVVAPGEPGWVVTGGGALAVPADPAGWGQLLTATDPVTATGTATPNGWHAAAKDHQVASPGTVQAFAVNLKFAGPGEVGAVALAAPAANTGATLQIRPTGTRLQLAPAPQQTAPVQIAPQQAVPVQIAPQQLLPVQSVPLQVAPMQMAPMQAAPVQAAPALEAKTGVMLIAPVLQMANQRWVKPTDAQPVIAPNSEILLFIHGMDSRAEEADDITKALFAEMASPSQLPASPPSPNPMVPVLNQLLKKYKDCILEKYETSLDMVNRGLPANASGLGTTNGLFPRDGIACVAGNLCTLASRTAGFAVLQAQANSGNPTNFQATLETIIPKDCFQCSKHAELHTKHVHCTMEAGGNSGFQGPGFEACKAGVDLNALAMAIRQEVAGVIRNITNDPLMAPDVTGGPSIATNHSTVSFTACANPAGGCPEVCPNPDRIVNGRPTAVLPPGYFEPMIPTILLDSLPPNGAQMNVPAARNFGQNEGRLNSELRAAARAAAKAPDPGEILRLAAAQFAIDNVTMGNAFADLSVTGRHSFDTFMAKPPGEAFCQSLVQPPAVPQPDATRLLNGCRTALDRAYRVANFLRNGQRGDTPALKDAKIRERNALGWIAVSGEDDSPHRPVNVPSSDYPQYDLVVPVDAPMAPPGSPRTIPVRTRYTIAQFRSPVTGRNLVMISLDLPTSGYADNLDYQQVSALTDIGTPKWTPLPIPVPVPPGIDFLIPGGGFIPPGTIIPPGTPLPDFQATGRTPVLDFIETFIVSFTNTLEQKVPIKGQIKAVMGGSLGGNMSFRLGRRTDVPWLPTSVVWSPASSWTSLGAGPDIFKHFGVRSAWEGANKARNAPGDGDRAGFFGSWDKPILPLLIPMAQSDTWTSDNYPCKKSSVAAARLDRQETYDQNFLAWHWRLGGEQLLFSHSNTNPATGRPLFMSNTKPMLLACGMEDRVRFNDICPATMSTALQMTLTPGKALFLNKTGHSLDNERAGFWAKQMVAFLGL